MHVALRHPQEVTGLVDGHRKGQGVRIRHSHVLAGEADESSCDIQRILAPIQHPVHPVDRRVRIAVAHGFVEGGNQVVVFLPVLVIQQRPAVHALGQDLLVHAQHRALVHPAVQHRHLQRIQRRSGVSVGEPGNRPQILLPDGKLHISIALGAFQGMMKKLQKIVLLQSFQDEDLAPGQKSGIDLKGRILRSRPHQNDASLFHKGQEGVLLGLVEPVNLVRKEQGPNPHPPVLLRLVHDLLHFLDAACHRAEFHKFRPGLPGDNPGQGRLAHAGRPPENHGRNLILLNQLAQDFPRPHQVLLPHIFLQGLRPQAAGQRRSPIPVIKKTKLLHHTQHLVLVHCFFQYTFSGMCCKECISGVPRLAGNGGVWTYGK